MTAWIFYRYFVRQGELPGLVVVFMYSNRRSNSSTNA